MKPTLNEKFLAYLALFSGLFLSLVAEYYSILGLTSIFSAAVIPVVIMGIALGLGKITATLWLKQNWSIAPWSMRIYLFTAIMVLMIVTSMGIFGFLSKAHSDQSLVSGDVQAKISVYDEKIRTSQENIDVNRKALKQLDEAVDQVMGRSTSETGADKAVAVRRNQQKERGRLLAEITAEQKTITGLREERAPIAAEVRKVEAEVGPIKYIAQFVYGETNEGLLEKAVTWVIIILIVVFDPLAVILLLSSQISFQNFREREDPNERELEEFADAFNEVFYEPDDGPLTDQQIEQIKETVTESNTPNEPVNEKYVKWPGGQEPLFCYKCATELVNAPGIGFFCPNKSCDVKDGPFDDDEPEVEKSLVEQHPYLNQPFSHFENLKPLVHTPEFKLTDDVVALKPATEYVVEAALIDALEGTVNRLQQENEDLKKEVDLFRAKKLTEDVKLHGYSSDGDVVKVDGVGYPKEEFDRLNSYIQNEEQAESGRWKELNSKISEEEYIELAKKKKNDNSNNAS